jgi:hypothetical protein
MLGELCAWMRSVGATSARVGDVSLTLGAPIVEPSVLVEASQLEAVTHEDLERYEIETLLHSSGADVTPFLRRRSA